MTPRRTPIAVLLTLAAIVSVACGRGSERIPQALREPSPPSAPAEATDAAARSDLAIAKGGAAQLQQVHPLGPAMRAVRDSTPPSMIIRTGMASVEVDSLDAAIAAVKALAARLGGYVGNVQLQAGETQVRSATLEVKLPSARYDEAVAGLAPFGRVETVSTSAEDVGEEFVDLTARQANAKRLEDRLVSLLATRTGKLEDVLAVERELARVREEIERYDGRLRFLRHRVSLSTLSITVHEQAPLVSAPGTNVMGEAFTQAWRNFVGFVAAFIASLGWLVPTGALVTALVLLVRRAWRARFRQEQPMAS